MFEILCAYLLDLIVGDPVKLPHPVRWIGSLIALLEGIYRRLFTELRIAGIFLTATVVLLTYFVTAGILYAASLYASWFSFLVGTLILFSCFSVRSLINASIEVLKRLKNGDLPGARLSLSHIVGRDTGSLNEEQITRATVETVSENSVDGFISPLFYALLGGPALAMTYKAVNTLDSMVGYKNEKYIDLGWASARLDDVVNYLPARISVFFISLASLFLGRSARRSFTIGFRDGRNHTSPNSGFSEAAFAGALEVQLGGPSTYGGKTVEKPYIGDKNEALQQRHIKQANSLLLITSIISVTAALLALSAVAFYW